MLYDICGVLTREAKPLLSVKLCILTVSKFLALQYLNTSQLSKLHYSKEIQQLSLVRMPLNFRGDILVFKACKVGVGRMMRHSHIPICEPDPKT